MKRPHLHECNSLGCRVLVECVDECIEDMGETVVYCTAHAPALEMRTPGGYKLIGAVTHIRAKK